MESKRFGTSQRALFVIGIILGASGLVLLSLAGS